jgi:hypothetical protein
MIGIKVVTLGFSHAKWFLPKIIHGYGKGFQNFRQPFPWPKKCNEYGFEEAPNYQPARGAHISRAVPADPVTENILLHQSKYKISVFKKGRIARGRRFHLNLLNQLN